MAGLVTLQNLQNLASLQQSLPQVASLAVGLQNMSNLPGSSVVNAPLNLSVGSSGKKFASSASLLTYKVSLLPIGNLRNISNGPTVPDISSSTPVSINTQSTTTSSVSSLLATQQPAPMPQLILASGQLVQGIQGAQLLIPTSQGKRNVKNMFKICNSRITQKATKKLRIILVGGQIIGYSL